MAFRESCGIHKGDVALCVAGYMKQCASILLTAEHCLIILSTHSNKKNYSSKKIDAPWSCTGSKVTWESVYLYVWLNDLSITESMCDALTWRRLSRCEAIICILRHPQPQPISSTPEQKWSTGPEHATTEKSRLVVGGKMEREGKERKGWKWGGEEGRN